MNHYHWQFSRQSQLTLCLSRLCSSLGVFLRQRHRQATCAAKCDREIFFFLKKQVPQFQSGNCIFSVTPFRPYCGLICDSIALATLANNRHMRVFFRQSVDNSGFTSTVGLVAGSSTFELEMVQRKLECRVLEIYSLPWITTKLLCVKTLKLGRVDQIARVLLHIRDFFRSQFYIYIIWDKSWRHIGIKFSLRWELGLKLASFNEVTMRSPVKQSGWPVFQG